MGQSINDACIEIRRIVFKLKNLHNESCNVLLNSKSISNVPFLLVSSNFPGPSAMAQSS